MDLSFLDDLSCIDISNSEIEKEEKDEEKLDIDVYDLFFSLDIDWKNEVEKRKDTLKETAKTINSLNLKYGIFYPNKEDIYKTFILTQLKDVKVVIWGQDPYPQLLNNGKCRAQGYAFGVDRKDEIPSSLRNIYKEIYYEFSNLFKKEKIDMKAKVEKSLFKMPSHGDLTRWTSQGVLLINTSFTYCPVDPKSHITAWLRFVVSIIEILNENVKDCIHILWGNNAQKLASEIKSKYILKAAHPSGFSAHRGFFDCKHFVQTNIILKRLNKSQIDWNVDEHETQTYIESLKKIIDKPKTK